MDEERVVPETPVEESEEVEESTLGTEGETVLA